VSRLRLIDANIIAYAFYDNPYTEKCQDIIKKGGFTDTIALIEAFNIIEHEVSREYASSSIRSIMKSSIRILTTDINLVFEALRKTQKIGLRFIDLIHYVSAKISGCTEIMTYDKDFDNLDIKRVVP
jgi:predicted nucleic acid-binding protein